MNTKTTEEQFQAIPDDEKQKYFDMVVNVLGDSLWCSRVWDAWWVGTMTHEDFHSMCEDDDYVLEKAIELYVFTKSLELPNEHDR